MANLWKTFSSSSWIRSWINISSRGLIVGERFWVIWSNLGQWDADAYSHFICVLQGESEITRNDRHSSTHRNLSQWSVNGFLDGAINIPPYASFKFINYRAVNKTFARLLTGNHCGSLSHFRHTFPRWDYSDWCRWLQLQSAEKKKFFLRRGNSEEKCCRAAKHTSAVFCNWILKSCWASLIEVPSQCLGEQLKIFILRMLETCKKLQSSS